MDSTNTECGDMSRERKSSRRLMDTGNVSRRHPTFSAIDYLRGESNHLQTAFDPFITDAFKKGEKLIVCFA